MLNTLKQWWNENERSAERQPELLLCITKLMVGMMGMDGKFDDCEREEIVRLLGDHFGQSRQQSLALIEQGDAADLRFNEVVHQITSAYSVEGVLNFV
jgi:uncharacterized tellurite resistance protein B-like protein